MADEEDRVVVRMYRQTLGDCFLLTVWSGGRCRHTLIDCGVLQNVQSGEEMLGKLPREVIDEVGEAELRQVRPTKEMALAIARDVVATVKGRKGRIDLLVITHEHYDHVGAFTLADDENPFLDPELTIGELWLAWTENPADAQARDLQARLGKGREAMGLAVEAARQARREAQRLGADGGRQAEMAEALEQVVSLAEFIGPITGPGLPATGRKTTAEAIQSMKDKVGRARTRFLEPGEVLGPSDGEGPGLKTYVLAPPRDEKRLRKDLPTGKGEQKEVYLTEYDEAGAIASAARMELKGQAFRAAEARVPLAEAPPEQPRETIDPPPFAPPHHRPYPSPKPEDLDPNEPRALLQRLYENPDTAYRGISADWTDAANSLALKIDSDTNNTSLVLAFELPDGRVLLFPGDAQVGNWESWSDQAYPSDAFRKEGDPASKPIDDILGRVVFYKVGHHASHNATLRRGLEQMTDPRLCAAIPVVEAVAAVQGPGRKTAGRGWKMPYGHLYEELRNRTGERIVRGDGVPEVERRAFAAGSGGVTLDYEDKETGGLWVELSFPLARTG